MIQDDNYPVIGSTESTPNRKRQDFSIWKSRLSIAEGARAPFLDEGAKFERGYQGQIIPQQNKENMQVNLIYVDVKRAVTTMYSKNPKIFFEQSTPGGEKAADILEIAVNQRWYDLKMKKKVRDAIKSAKLYGVVGFKTYYFVGDYKGVYDDSIQSDEVRTDFIPLKHLLKDPASTWYTTPWVAHEVLVPIKNLKNMFSLPEGAEPTPVSMTAKEEDISPKNRSDFQFGAYYEIEDREARQIGYIVKGVDGFVKRKGDKKKWRDFPYKYDSCYDFLTYNDIPNNPEVYADYHFYWMHLVNLCRYRTMQTLHAIRGASKYKVMGQPLTDVQSDQLSTFMDTSYVELQAGQDIQPLVHANLDPSILQTEGILRSDIQLYSQLVPQNPSSDKTATQAKIEEMGAQEVQTEALEVLEEVLASIATKWASLMQENYDATRIINITEMPDAEYIKFRDSLADEIQEKGRSKYLKFNKEDISGYEFKGRVRAGSTLADSDQTRMQKLMGFTKFLGSLNLMGAVDMEELVKEGAKVFGVENENILKKKNNPIEENRLLDANVMVPVSISDDDEAHLEEHKMASNTAAAVLHRAIHEKQKQDKLRAQEQAMKRQMSMNMPDVMSGASAAQPNLMQGLQGGGQVPSPVQPQTSPGPMGQGPAL